MGATEQVVLMRAGHYFTPSSSEGEDLAGGCQGATVADVEIADDVTVVNLDVVTHRADHLSRIGVPVEAPGIGTASFHLTRDCPWSR